MTEPFLLRALLAGLGLALVAAPFGCFVVWRRMAYFGETVAQAGLIGVALGLLFSINMTLAILITTLAMSIVLLLLARQTIVPMDSLLGLLAHAALAAGVIAAAMVRGPTFDLMSFLFGDIFAISTTDLQWIYLGGAFALGILIWIWRPLLAVSVHEDLASAEGQPVQTIKITFVILLALVVAIAIKIVGALLTIAFLIMPAAAARPFAETPEQMAVVAVIFGMLSVAIGLFMSVAVDTPGGPSIVLVLAGLFASSLALYRRRA
jgi:zinc transport system permease protein